MLFVSLYNIYREREKKSLDSNSHIFISTPQLEKWKTLIQPRDNRFNTRRIIIHHANKKVTVMVQYPEKKKNGRENVNAKKIKRQRASCAILKRKRNERERVRYYSRQIGLEKKRRSKRESHYYRGYLGEFATESLRVRCRCSHKQRGH